jgi:hypothetical protein
VLIGPFFEIYIEIFKGKALEFENIITKTELCMIVCIQEIPYQPNIINDLFITIILSIPKKKSSMQRI